MASLTFLQSQGEPVQGSFGGLPVAERNSTYIAYFQSVGGTGPEIIDQSAYFISYLIDEKGNISNPLNNEISLENLYQNFEIGKNAVASLELPTTNNSQLNGEYKITGIGTIQPILVTETGSSPQDFTSSINFEFFNGNPVTPNALDFNLHYYEDNASLNLLAGTSGRAFLASFISSVSNTGNDNIIMLSGPGNPEVGGPSGGNLIRTASFITSENDAGTQIGIRFTLDLLAFGSNSQEIVTLVQPLKNGQTIFRPNGTIISNFISWNPSEIATSGQNAINNNPPGSRKNLDFNIEFDDCIFEAGDEIVLLVGDISRTSQQIIHTRQRNILTFQEYLPGGVSIEGVNQSTPPYFFSGSNLDPTHTWITASNSLSTIHFSSNKKQITPEESLDFGFSPINQIFQIKKGDIIRFEYSQDQSYTITEVDNGSPLKFKIFPSIPNNIELNHFVIYRLDRDGKYIILDIDKNSGNTPGGILRPKYLPKSFEDNYDNVLGILRDKGILKDSLSLGDITN